MPKSLTQSRDVSLAETGAVALMDVAPSVVRFIRTHMRRRIPALSIAQFRTLAFVGRHRGCSLTDVADYLGVTLSTASVLVDRLVRQELLSRTPDEFSRRRVTLALTRGGTVRLVAARESARRELTELLASVPDAALSDLIRGLNALAVLPTLMRRDTDR